MAWPTTKQELEDRIYELQVMNTQGMLRPDDIQRNRILIDAYKEQLKQMDNNGG